MTHELKVITSDEQEKILADAGEKAVHLKARGGHFNNNHDLTWAIDEEDGSYLFWSPRLPMDIRYFYYFFKEGKMYALVLDSESSAVVRPLDGESDFKSPELRRSVCDAFAVYGVYGVHGRSGLKVQIDVEG